MTDTPTAQRQQIADLWHTTVAAWHQSRADVQTARRHGTAANVNCAISFAYDLERACDFLDLALTAYDSAHHLDCDTWHEEDPEGFHDRLDTLGAHECEWCPEPDFSAMAAAQAERGYLPETIAS